VDTGEPSEKPSFAELSGSGTMQAVSTVALIVLAATAATAKSVHAPQLVVIVISVLLLAATFAFAYVAARWIALAQASIADWINMRGGFDPRRPK
jgi:predicted Na+-dependent transporter